MFTVADLSSLWMIAAVNEDSLSQLRVGQPARVYVQAYPERGFRGKVSRLDEELDPTTRTIKARVDLGNSGGLLKPEMYATAEIELGESAPALFVPQEAIQQVEGNTVVFVRRGADRFDPRPVTTGRTIGSSIEIERGLSAGEEVVTRGSFLVKSQLLKSTMAAE
jgi:cobalt-zinc-cadmium efflux system membrane fusion protein